MQEVFVSLGCTPVAKFDGLHQSDTVMSERLNFSSAVASHVKNLLLKFGFTLYTGRRDNIALDCEG